MIHRDRRHCRLIRLSRGQWVLTGTLAVLIALSLGCVIALAQDLTVGKTTQDVDTAALSTQVTDDQFHYGVYVDGISLGGLTMEQAQAKVKQNQEKLIMETNVRIYSEDDQLLLPLQHCQVSFDTDAVLTQAMAIGRQGTSAVQMQAYLAQLPNNPVQLSTTATVDPSCYQGACVEFCQGLEREVADATVLGFDGNLPEGERWVTVEEQTGRVVDYDAMWAAVEASFNSGKFEDVEIPAQITYPEVTLEELMANRQLIVSFASELHKDENRTSNVRTACAVINEFVFEPGVEFSFNNTTGPRTKENGYKEAGVIKGGDRLDTGLGGGICQVSGMLYNVAVMSDMKIIDRQPHSFELSYLPRGRDATVDYGNKDLVIQNTSANPITVVMWVTEDESQVIAETYGTPLENGMTIGIVVETLEKPKPSGDVTYVELNSLDKGETIVVQPQRGVVAQSYRVYYDATGVEMYREPLYLDTYPAINAKVYYSPKDSESFARSIWEESQKTSE